MKRILFIGSKQLGLSCLKKAIELAPKSICAVMTLDDRKDTRSVYHHFLSFARNHMLRLYVSKGVTDLQSCIKRQMPDLCIVAGWYQIIPKELIRLVPEGFIGLHGSLLPRYRGGAPLVWSMINQEKKTGITLFYFDEGMDSGDIIDQAEFTINPDDEISNLLDKSEKGALKLLESHYISLLNGNAPRRVQNHDLATYCTQRCPEDGRINWNQPASHICSFIKAQSMPYPGAFTTVDNKKLYIWKARKVDLQITGTPGQVANIDGRLLICCGCGAIEPLLTQFENSPLPERAQAHISHGKRL